MVDFTIKVVYHSLMTVSEKMFIFLSDSKNGDVNKLFLFKNL